MPTIGSVVQTAHGPGRVTHIHARVQEPDGTLGYLVTAELERPYDNGRGLGGLERVTRLEAIVPLEQQ